jgi:hypothetical protein
MKNIDLLVICLLESRVSKFTFLLKRAWNILLLLSARCLAYAKRRQLYRQALFIMLRVVEQYCMDQRLEIMSMNAIGNLVCVMMAAGVCFKSDNVGDAYACQLLRRCFA